MAGRIREMWPCELCGHSYGQAHRLNPGRWGGEYDDDNVVYLCPNHHAGIHLIMKWYYKGSKKLTVAEGDRLEDALLDRPLYNLWAKRCKRHVREQMKREGRWIGEVY